MLHPKILMLTNNKKWNAPFFGPVIRMADYFPAEQVEQNIDRIARKNETWLFPYRISRRAPGRKTE